ncbi:RING-type E3 ubiquitin transferase [Ranunculus cassubicifolius]
MASDSDPAAAAATSFLEQLINSRNRDISSFLPLILGFSRSRRSQQQDSDHEDHSDDDDGDSVDQARGRIVLINPLTQGMIVIESSRSLEEMIREFASKEGPKPASKSSIEAMPKVVVTEDDKEKECCPICIEDWVIGEEAREMPCKHRYHGKCIEKWLNMHGSCPVCRHKMPVDDEDESRKVSNDGGEGGRRGEIWVSFATFGSRRESSTNGSSDVQNAENVDSSESS